MNSQVKQLFETFCKAYNLKTSATTIRENPEQTTFYSNDFIKMDFNPHYGGYRMDIVTKGTGERFFDSSERRTKSEMVAYLRGLITAKQSYPFEGIVNS